MPTPPPPPAVAARIEVAGATKVIDGLTVLDDVSFSAEPGRVTALLGPNGAGKSTVLRAVLGLVRLTSGSATVGGRPLAEHPTPARVLGALLTPDAVHPRQRAHDHLAVVAAANGLPADRVPAALRLVGIEDLADLATGQMSLGMRQRLALATALLGDPAAVVLDEPHNGLDAAAIRWLRDVLRRLADAGRTVLVCSHLMSELQVVADDVVVIDQGRVVVDTTVRDWLGRAPGRARHDALEARYLQTVGEA